MKGDFSRNTFRKKKHYRKVNMQQGRVGVDSDWNEQVDIEIHHEKTSLSDLVGESGAPEENPGFSITGTPRGYRIGKGRYYVEGILCENEEDIEGFDQPDLPPNIRIDYPDGPSVYSLPMGSGVYLAYLHVWQQHLTALDDPNIRESALGGADTGTRTKNVWQVQLLRISDSRNPSSRCMITKSIVAEAVINRPDLETVVIKPGKKGQDSSGIPSIEFINVDQQGGVFGIIEIKDPSANRGSSARNIIRLEIGIESDYDNVVIQTKVRENGSDTGIFHAELAVKDEFVLVGGKALGRLPFDSARIDATYAYETEESSEGSIHCQSRFSEWERLVRPSDGFLKARAQPEQQSNQPCIMTPQAKYTRLENQLYRVEIHNGGEIGSGDIARPTFKFSRDNGVVVTNITKIEFGKITVTNPGKDSYLGLAPVQWVEVIDDRRELWGIPGSIVRLDNVQENELTFTPDTVKGDLITESNFPIEFHPKVRRWDSEGAMETNIPSENDGYLNLESGIQVRFEEGMVKTGDYWLIPARTLKRDIEWPKTPEDEPAELAPEGITHYFSRLALLEYSAEGDIGHFIIKWDSIPENNDDANTLVFFLRAFSFIPVGTKPESVRVEKVTDTVFETIKITTEDKSLFITLNDKKPLATYAILSIDAKPVHSFIVSRENNVFTIRLGRIDIISDCRKIFPPATDPLPILYYVSGDGQQGSRGMILNWAIVAGVASGNKPLNESRVRFRIFEGGGTLESTPGTEGNTELILTTGSFIDRGTVACWWRLGSGQRQLVEAVLLDSDDKPVHLPIYYNAFCSSSINPAAGLSVTSGIITITKEFINSADNDLEVTTEKFSHFVQEALVPPAVILGKVPGLPPNEIRKNDVSFMEDYGLYNFVPHEEIEPQFKAVDINKETFRIKIKIRHATDKDLVLRFWAIPPAVVSADQRFPPSIG